jgi:putative membrane protein
MEKLHPGYKWSRRINSYLGVLFFAIFFPAFIAAAAESFTLFVLLFFTFLILGIFINEILIGLAYSNWKYEFTADVFKVEHGIIFKTYKSIPYERIQNVDIHRGIIARILGYSTVLLQTAGYSGWGGGRHGSRYAMAEGYLPAVSVQKAEQIRDIVTKKISKKK